MIGGTSTAANPACASAAAQPDDTTDNRRSVAFVLRYGQFDFYDAGDLTGDIEAKLACPADRVGAVDLYQVTHHGQANSNNPVLLATLKPTVAVMNNGPRKGGAAETFQRLKALPSLQALYAIHRSVANAADMNAAPENIANLDSPDAGLRLPRDRRRGGEVVHGHESSVRTRRGRSRSSRRARDGGDRRGSVAAGPAARPIVGRPLRPGRLRRPFLESGREGRDRQPGPHRIVPGLGVHRALPGDLQAGDLAIVRAAVRAVEDGAQDVDAVVVPHQQARLVEEEALHVAVRIDAVGEAIPQFDAAVAPPRADQLLREETERQRHVEQQGVAEEIHGILRPPRPPCGDSDEGVAMRRTGEALARIEREGHPSVVVDADMARLRVVVEHDPALSPPWRSQARSRNSATAACPSRALPSRSPILTS